MNISKKQAERVVHVANSYVNTPYSNNFRCVDFVRRVYTEVGIVIPLLKNQPPPIELNIKIEELDNPPVGHLMFLRDRSDPRKYRIWTHVVIISENNTCIHCSIFYGNKVTVTKLPDIFQRYEFVSSSQIAS